MAEIGFIGLGNMGGPMAANLVARDHRVKGFDLVEAARQQARSKGVEIVESAAEAARSVQILITMLPAGEHVREVYLGDEGLLATTPASTLLIDCSTIDVSTSREVHAVAEAGGFLMVDAPVSGGVAGAEGAALTFMVGGPEKAFAKARPVLECMGRKIVHAGQAGNGQAAKLCNNMILGISMIAISEAFTLAERIGLPPKTLFEISSAASGSCWAMLNHNPVPGLVEAAAANRDYKPGFAAAMMGKDLKLAESAAVEAGVATPLGSEASALYSLFVNNGHGGLDYSAIYKLIKGTINEG